MKRWDEERTPEDAPKGGPIEPWVRALMAGAWCRGYHAAVAAHRAQLQDLKTTPVHDRSGRAWQLPPYGWPPTADTPWVTQPAGEEL